MCSLDPCIHISQLALNALRIIGLTLMLSPILVCVVVVYTRLILKQIDKE